MKRNAAGQALFNAVSEATPSCSQMFTNVHACSRKGRSDETNPKPHIEPSTAARPTPGPRIVAQNPATIDPAPRRAKPSPMFTGVHASSPKTGTDETNPMTAPAASLTPRQVAAARLLALGRRGTAVAAEVGVEKHTITRWRRSPAFAAEVSRQHELVLAEQCRQLRAEKVDAFAAVADRVARKYGLVR